jgi:hypothetical protein
MKYLNVKFEKEKKEIYKGVGIIEDFLLCSIPLSTSSDSVLFNVEFGSC